MKRFSSLSLFLLICFAMSDTAAFALSWEVHPGLITSCEYSDNYYGVAYTQDPQSDTTYKVGPTLDFRIASERIAWDFSGYVTKDYHKRNAKEDSDEANIESGLNFTGINQFANLNYSYRRTSERQTLDSTWGEYTYHTGVAEYRYDFTDTDAINLRYTIEQEYAPEDPVYMDSNDLFSNRGEMLLELTPGQRHMLGISAKLEDYKYTDYARDNILTIVTDAYWMYSLLQNLRLGLEAAYTSNNPSRDPNTEIYEGFLRGEYGLTQYITIYAKAGYSCLQHEYEGSKGLAAGELRIERLTDSDHFILSGSKDFSYDYTTGSTYGMYETLSAALSWEHTFIREISMVLNGSIIRRDPESNTQNGTTDRSAAVTLRYMPFRWMTIDGTYTNLVTEYTEVNVEDGNTDTRRENRYTLNLGVRY